MTTTSPIRTIKPRISGSTNIQTLTNSGYDLKPSRICVKKPLNGTHFIQATSNTNGFGNSLRKRGLQFNHFFIQKPNYNDEISPKENDRSDHHIITSPLSIFLPVSPISTEETNRLSVNVNSENEKSASLHDQNHRNHQNGKIKQTHVNSPFRQSSCSDGDNHQDGSRATLSIDDTDADESDNEQRQRSTKSRRLQKTRKPINGSIQHKTENHNHHPTPSAQRNILRTDDKRRSSSNEEEENQESISRLNEIPLSSRRGKLFNTKKVHPLIVAPATTTTTDDELIRLPHHLGQFNHFKSILETTNSNTNESNLSSPNPTTPVGPTVRKINRFQVKSIRKSQQPHILLASATAAKSSNEDDCSVPNERSENEGRPTIVKRESINTPTTDGENSRIHHLNNNCQRSDSIQNGNHHVRFEVASNGKRASVLEEDKVQAPSTHTVTVTASTHPSSTTPAHGEMMKVIPGVSGWIPPRRGRSQSFFQDDEEEEAVGISPDGRFIKYAKEIGRGAFKTVYRGLDTETSVAVAWCELQDFAQFDKHERARFKEEAEMLKKLQHQNIVRFYDFWEETNARTNKKVIILVTELMTSGSLKSYIRKFKGQKEDKRINVMKKWCRQILKGLAYLHSRNPPVIHRDLKCDNVFISSTTGCVKIGDLGLATFKTQTFAKSMRGTMEFMAPEMFDEKYDELVDIYSFGLCMLEMITGEYPYIECKGPTAVIKRVTAGMKPDCYYKVENEDVREVIDCCIRTKKEERLPVNELLQHSFFLDDIGLRIELVRDSTNDHDEKILNEFIDFKLKTTDKTKRKALWTEHEAIRFRYNLKDDTPEQIVGELIEKKYIFDDDKKFVTQSIKDRLRAYQYEQIDRKAGVFQRDGKLTTNQTPLVGQATNSIQITTPQIPTTPITIPPIVSTISSVTPTPSLIQQPNTDLSQTNVSKPVQDSLPIKPIVPNETITVVTLPELGSNLSGSTRSLEVLDAALKKTFTKTNSVQSTHPVSIAMSDSSEPITPLTNPDETPISRSTSHSISIPDQQIIEEVVEITAPDVINQTHVLSNCVPIQNPCQSIVNLTNNHTSKTSTNPSLNVQTTSNISHSTIMQPVQSFQNNIVSNDVIVKQNSSSSSSSTMTDGLEAGSVVHNVQLSNEVLPNVILSDISSTTSPQIPGSLKQLNVLLTHTFKTSSKTTNTSHGSDTEASTSTTVQPITVPSLPMPISEDHSIKIIEIESDETKSKIFTGTSTGGLQGINSQSSTSSIFLPTTILPNKLQTISISNTSPFDPFTSPERIQDQSETVLKTPQDKSLLNDDTIIAASANDLSDLKSMILDLSKTLLQKMAAIEQKIDQHHQQTEKINNMLTDTLLPSLIDITDIIHETSAHLDPRVRSKLEIIRTSVHAVKQQTEVQDLMEI